MVHADENDVAPACNVLAVVGQHFKAGAVLVAAAVNPDENRPPSLVEGLRPYIEVEAVLAHQAVFEVQDEVRKRIAPVVAMLLQACVSVRNSVEDVFPWLRLLRRQEAIPPGRGSAVANTLEGVHAVPNVAADGSCRSLDHGDRTVEPQLRRSACRTPGRRGRRRRGTKRANGCGSHGGRCTDVPDEPTACGHWNSPLKLLAAFTVQKPSGKVNILSSSCIFMCINMLVRSKMLTLSRPPNTIQLQDAPWNR